jgi:3-oxoacyl-[acyl-carrier-protein] synthase III
VSAVVRAVGVVTGWGAGLAAIPADARAAAGNRRVIAAAPKPRLGDRLRRATRECLLAVDAVEALLDEAAISREAIAGDRTALIYSTTAAYGPSNRAFVEGGGRALHFPYTAPSAVPAEVAIEFGLHGAYTVLIGGATATVAALEHATTLLARGACDRAIVLAVETFAECEDLFARGRWLVDGPLVEAAAAALLEASNAEGGLGGASRVPPTSNKDGLGGAPRVPPTSINTLACDPLLDLAAALATQRHDLTLSAQWRGQGATMRLRLSEPGAVARS